MPRVQGVGDGGLATSSRIFRSKAEDLPFTYLFNLYWGVHVKTPANSCLESIRLRKGPGTGWRYFIGVRAVLNSP